MAELTTTRGALYGICNEARALQRIFESLDFGSLFNHASPEQQDALLSLLLNIDLIPVRRWIKMEQYKQYHTLTLRQLRIVAKTLGVKYYSMKTKEELLTDIGAVYEQREKRSIKADAVSTGTKEEGKG